MKKILYVDMDNVLVDFQSAIPKLPESVVLEHEGHLDEIPGIYALMNPMPDAIEAFRELAELFDAYVLSTAPWENPSAWSDKLLWIKRYLGPAAERRLIITHHKNLNAGHYLIDDRTERGASQFQGELVQFGSERFPNWVTVMGYLRGKN